MDPPLQMVPTSFSGDAKDIMSDSVGRALNKSYSAAFDTITIPCDKCGSTITIPDPVVGMTIKCVTCGNLAKLVDKTKDDGEDKGTLET